MNLYLKVFTHKKMAVLLLLGFSSGLPLALTFGTLQAWMKESEIGLAEIGAVTLIGLPYTIKFLWAPLMDRVTLPFLGRRRGWIFLTQLALMGAISWMARFDPTTRLSALIGTAVLVAFLSASQDIVVDGYRSDILEPDELGAGAAVFVMGYRIGMLISGAFALILADLLPWQTVYTLIAPFMLVGMVATWWGSEPVASSPRTLTEAVVEPFHALFHRKEGAGGILLLLALVVMYKLPDAISGAMTTPFLMDIGFSKTDIGVMNKGWGLIATLLGGFAGGAIFSRIGLYRSLWAFGLLQGVSNLVFIGLSMTGVSTLGLFLAVGIENLSGGMGTIAFVALLMRLTERRYSATQYALLSSLAAITSRVAGPAAGLLAESVRWPLFYGLSVLGAIPGLALLAGLSAAPVFGVQDKND
jgi:PAT family beta-lactamase induction signal transducer AmpG